MERKIKIAMNGVTGRMGTNQHLIRSVLAIRDRGGIIGPDGDAIIPEPVLVGRNEKKLKRLANAHNCEDYSTDLDAVLSDSEIYIYFDSSLTQLRAEGVSKAIAAGKAVYCEKPTATTTEEAMGLAREAKRASVKNGVVQDKLWLPGLLKLKYLIDTGFFGRILSVRGDFGYWVFDGKHQATQRPSWNYRKEDGGGIMIDMFCHWRYVIDNLFGKVRAVSAVGTTNIKERVDEQGRPYRCTADDEAFGTFELDNGILCQFRSSWTTRVRRDDLLTIQVDGSNGSALAGLRECWVSSDAETPKPVWNPDIHQPINFFDSWMPMPTRDPYENAFKAQWELFLRHVAFDEPFPWGLKEGAKGVQLAELGLESWQERRWIEVPELE